MHAKIHILYTIMQERTQRKKSKERDTGQRPTSMTKNVWQIQRLLKQHCWNGGLEIMLQDIKRKIYTCKKHNKHLVESSKKKWSGKEHVMRNFS
jgi:hypothetical protein